MTPRPHLFPHIDRSMTAYLAEHLDLSAYAANELRQFYWRRYGATLVGLIRHHGIDPHHFLRENPPIPSNRGPGGGPPRTAIGVCGACPGHKIVFFPTPRRITRGRSWRRWVWTTCFDDVFSIEAHPLSGPSPDAHGFRRLLRTQPAAGVALHHGRGQPREPAHRQTPGNEDRLGGSVEPLAPPGWTRMSVTSYGCRGCCACSRPALTTEDAEDAEEEQKRGKAKVGLRAERLFANTWRQRSTAVDH